MDLTKILFKKSLIVIISLLLVLFYLQNGILYAEGGMAIRDKTEEIGKLLIKHEYEKVFRNFNNKLKQEVPSARLSKIMSDLEEKNGPIEIIERLQAVPNIQINFEDITKGLWSIRFLTSDKKPLDLLLAFNSKRELSGIWLFDEPDAEAAEIKNSHYKNKTQLSLPFKGGWVVIQGGFSKVENHHLRATDGQSGGSTFAYDFVMVYKGKAYRSKGRRLKDYYSYGQPVTAPADGRVIQVVDGISDTPLGMSNVFHAAGNVVVIDHGSSEYSLIAHLKKDSIRIKEGDELKRGQIIGSCGNSGGGALSVPHIHYQLMERPYVWESVGLPVTFSNIILNGVPQKRAKLKRGDFVQDR